MNSKISRLASAIIIIGGTSTGGIVTLQSEPLDIPPVHRRTIAYDAMPTKADIRALLPKPKPKPKPVVQPRAYASGPSTGRCGGSLPSCSIMACESKGNIRAENPRSSASGKWQMIDSTWGGFGGYSRASHAPESVQDEKARQLWAGGAGARHWSPCL